MSIPGDEGRALFLELVELDEAERQRQLDARCGPRAALRAEVEALLRDDACAEGFLEPPPLAHDTDAEGRWLEGRAIGRYVLRRRVGMGGMGTVYEAMQARPRRRVALKLLRTGLVTPSLLRRFELEAEILGRLRHAGIAEIYEAGTHESELGPIPFFALEFVDEARTLTRYAEEQPLDVPARLHLLASVCDAVHHAHTQGVIHRDIKPSNILVGRDGRPLLIDFGVARAIDEERGITLGTQVGELVGTLCYMSPEQCSADGADVDLRTDVYALGVMAYELVAGRLPYPVEGVSAFMVTELVRNHVPRPPSRRGMARGRDIDAVVLRALEKQPRHRYASALELGDDLRRVAGGRPPLAARSRGAYTLRMLAWRGRRALPMAAAVCITGLGVWGVSRPAELAVETVADVETDLAAAREQDEREAYRSLIVQAERSLGGHEPARARAALERCAPSRRGFEWYRLRALVDRSAQTLAVGSPVHALARDPATGMLVAVSEDGRLHAWQAEGPGLPPTFALRWVRPTDDAYLALALEPAAGVVYCGGDRKTVHAFALADGTPRGSFAAGEDSIWSLAIGGDPAQLFVTRTAGTVERWDLARRELVYARPITARLGDAELADEALFVAVREGVSMRSLDTTDELQAFATPEQPEAILVGERELFAAGWENQIFAFDRATGARRELPPQGSGILDLERVDARTLAAADRDGSIALWDVDAGVLRRRLHGHEHGVEALAVAPAGRWLASASLDGTVRTWDLHAPPTEVTLHGATDKVHAVAFVDEGRALVGAIGPHWDPLDEDALMTWSLSDGRVLATAYDHGTTVDVLGSSPDGRTLATAGRDGEIVLRDASLLVPRRRIAAHAGRIAALVYTPDGAWLLSTGHDGTLAAWDATDGRLLARAEPGLGSSDDASWTTRGLVVAVGGGLVLWSGRSDDPPRPLPVQVPGGLRIARVATLSQARVVVGGDDGSIALLDLDRSFEDALVWASPTFGRAVSDLSVSPDGERIAVASQDHRIRLHDARTGELLLGVGEHESVATSVAFAPDGSAIASGGFDKLARVWLAPGGCGPGCGGAG